MLRRAPGSKGVEPGWKRPRVVRYDPVWRRPTGQVAVHNDFEQCCGSVGLDFAVVDQDNTTARQCFLVEIRLGLD